MLSDSEKRRRLERALEFGGSTHTVGDVVDLVKAGRAQFWNNGDGTVVTELYEFPRLRTVHFWLVAGNLEACLALQPNIEGWARDKGCSQATAVGRHGWEPVLTHAGWHVGGVRFVKDLEHV